VHHVGKYEIVSEIGRGAMGAVYKARDPLIGRLVALKTITSGVSSQPNSLERFYQEARSAGALQHPNIVTIYELGQDNNTPFIAMEYIEGGSLDQLIEQKQALPLSLKLGYIVRVCEALSYAHRHNVIHRDVKPANIMVTKDGVVKVVDFGIARLTDMSLTQPNMMIGSRAYMSPQLYKGERADARADIWAVGVSLYELVAYRRPFDGDSEAELMFHILSDPPPALQSVASSCPDELASIVGRMLEKKAQDRYQSMDDVLRDLEPLWKSAQQSTVAGLLADCQQLVSAKDLQRAQGLLRKALQIDSTNTQAKSLLEKVTVELRRSQVLPKVNEHLNRGRGFLQTGKLREARAEVEAALGLDSRHEPAHKLLAELGDADARAQEVEQKLRLTKQRLAEGALTEAATALGAVLELDRANAQAQELHRQIDEERSRRERRKKLSEVLHHARTLWTALNYEECLRVLSAALKDFPNEPELTKLQEMARHDLDDLQKQRRMGEARKLLGEQKFSEAAKIAGDLAREHPHDTAVRNLQMLAIEGEQEEKKRKRFAVELAGLRTLLSDGNFAAAVSKGDALLGEYPDEFELKELVGYARGEVAQQEQRDREKRIRGLLEREEYREAELLARRGTQEFPRQDVFRKLAEEAGQKIQAQRERDRTQQEMLRRIDEIRRNLSQEKISDAITLAQQTLGAFGPDPGVTQLLNTANAKQEERKKKEEQERQFVAAQTMVQAGNFAGAAQVLNQAMATQIFERSDPRVQRRLREIERLSVAASVKPTADLGTAGRQESTLTVEKSKSAEKKQWGAERPSPPPLFSEGAVLGPGTSGALAGSGGAEAAPAVPGPGVPRTGERNAALSAMAGALAWVQNEWRRLVPRILPALRKPVVFGTAGGVVLVLALVVVTVAMVKRGPSKKEKDLRAQALQQWSSHELDGSEQTWRQVQGMHGGYLKEAGQKIQEIEEKRLQESQRFQEGENLLNDQKDYARAVQAFQDVIQMNLWLTDKARVEYERATTIGSAMSLSEQEQMHFNQGKTFFDQKSYDNARKEFQAARDLNVPNSSLRQQIDGYLKRVAQNADAKKLYELAMTDIKNENWAGAQQQLQELVDRKVPTSADAKQRLADVEAAQKAEESFHQTLQAGAYREAKDKLDAMQWPKTKDRLLKELRTTENKRAQEINDRANAMQANGDVDGILKIQTEFRRFTGQMEDPSLTTWANNMNGWLDNVEKRLKTTQGDKEVFDAAVADFNATKEKGDLKRMQGEVTQKFKKIAQGAGSFRSQAQEYVSNAIPSAILELQSKSVGAGKIVVPQINCAGEGSSEPPEPSLQNVTCAQLDANSPLQWAQIAIVEMPGNANQKKLPYTLHLTVTVDASGKVKVEKVGEVDNDFFKKAKDAAKHWKTTIPKAGGKPVSVKFPFSITFSQ